jgi:hypothetical protein
MTCWTLPSALTIAEWVALAPWDEDSSGTIGELVPVEFAQDATRATDICFL